MLSERFKLLSVGVGTAFGVVVLLAVVALGAMFFADDGEELFSRERHKVTQAMELRGEWLGMKLASLDSPSARRRGVPPSERGVLVLELSERKGWRVRQAGVLSGDVVEGLNGNEIRDMADLFKISRKVDVGSAVTLDIRRWGQPMTLVLPAVFTAPPVAGRTRTAQGANAGAAQAGAEQAARIQRRQGPQFYCPQHNKLWSKDAVHPNYRCPLGNGLLNRVR